MARKCESDGDEGNGDESDSDAIRAMKSYRDNGGEIQDGEEMQILFLFQKETGQQCCSKEGYLLWGQSDMVRHSYIRATLARLCPHAN
jgi:hypothetical protein